jgi:hypothetical protein
MKSVNLNLFLDERVATQGAPAKRNLAVHRLSGPIKINRGVIYRDAI